MYDVSCLTFSTAHNKNMISDQLLHVGQAVAYNVTAWTGLLGKEWANQNVTKEQIATFLSKTPITFKKKNIRS